MMASVIVWSSLKPSGPLVRASVYARSVDAAKPGPPSTAGHRSRDRVSEATNSSARTRPAMALIAKDRLMVSPASDSGAIPRYPPSKYR